MICQCQSNEFRQIFEIFFSSTLFYQIFEKKMINLLSFEKRSKR